MKMQDFKRICDSEQLGYLYGIFYYPDNLLPGDPLLRTVSVFARCSVPMNREKEEYTITPDFQVNPEHQVNAWGWRTFFDGTTPHSDLVRKFFVGEGTEEELLKLIHIFKKGYKEILIKDKITSLEKDFV